MPSEIHDPSCMADGELCATCKAAIAALPPATCPRCASADLAAEGPWHSITLRCRVCEPAAKA